MEKLFELLEAYAAASGEWELARDREVAQRNAMYQAERAAAAEAEKQAADQVGREIVIAGETVKIVRVSFDHGKLRPSVVRRIKSGAWGARWQRANWTAFDFATREWVDDKTEGA